MMLIKLIWRNNKEYYPLIDHITQH